MTRPTSQKAVKSKAPQAIKLAEEVRVASANIRKAASSGKPPSAVDVEVLRGSAEALIELAEA